LAMLSHELRNPLASIQNSLAILNRAAPGGEQARQAKAIIDRQVGQLARLVDDLLDITRVTQNKIQLQLEQIELNELVRRTIEDHRPLFEKNGVRLEAGYAPSAVVVRADKTRLAQVVGNLLQNAAKFTDRGGSARVSVGCDAAGRRAVIRVADTGIGMSPEVLEQVFQPFVQADTTLDRSRGGLGLGLALCKGLIELHGGDVAAYSDGAGRGSEFTVRLPLVEAAYEEPRPQAAPPEGFRRRRVLIIEDNVDLAESLRELLELDGHEAAVAYGGVEGLAKAREFLPEIVLCDIGLPGMDGYAVAEAFRADAQLKTMYLVALSGYAQPEDLKRAVEAGFDRHVAKPPDFDALDRMLRQAP
ncbi:MAG: ATP-binding protein, partial [Bacteroidota bacterium]